MTRTSKLQERPPALKREIFTLFYFVGKFFPPRSGLKSSRQKSIWTHSDLDPDPQLVFRIRIGFNANPVLGSHTNANTCGSGSWSDSAITKSLIEMKKPVPYPVHIINNTFVIKHIYRVPVRRYERHIERLEIKVYLFILVNFLAPRSGSAFPISRSGSRRAKSLRIHANPDLKHCPEHHLEGCTFFS